MVATWDFSNWALVWTPTLAYGLSSVLTACSTWPVLLSVRIRTALGSGLVKWARKNPRPTR